MRIDAFLAELRPHDLSSAIGLLELIRRADDDGALERAPWFAAVRATHARVVAASHNEPVPDADDQEGEPGELGHYLDDNILARLEAAGIAAGEPAGDGWECARVQPAVWQEVRADREGVVERLENAVRILLVGPVRRPSGEQGAPVVIGDSTLSARGLNKVYRKRRVVADVDVQVSQGEIVGLLGPNGAGKTTTFYMMVGLISPDEGKVFLDAQELTRMPMYKRARLGVGYLAQEPSIFRKLTVEENILAILETMKLSRAERRERLETLLDELGIKHLRGAKAYSLSGGERRRLEITRALVSRPKFMLLDEPFAGVDPIAVHDIQQIVADLRHRGIGVIISDHNVEQTLDIVDRAYIMYEGQVRVSGTVAELVWNEEVAEIYFGPTLTARMRQRYPRPEVAA